MRIAARRALAAAFVVPVLAFTAACSGTDSGDDGKDGKHGKNESSGAGHGGSADQDPSSEPDTALSAALSERQLKQAALTAADLGGDYQVSETDAKEELRADPATADKPQCQPIADVLSAKPKYERVATVSRNAVRTDTTGKSGALALTYLASHRPGEAEKAFAELKRALGDCESFTAKEKNEKVLVAKARAAQHGDESVAFTFAEAASGQQSMVIHVVRVGTTLASFAGLDLTGGKPSVPEAIITKQAEKLQGVSPKG